MNYYNEFDPKAAAWLRELIARGHIPPGDVDERSITEVRPHEVAKYTQQHFFAGIGGWPLALRLSGWPDSKPVRTGSCPCQPFSIAGQGLGTADERHLWPNFRDLITFGEPTITFGEQVASKAGREWLAGVRADLEGLGYEVGAADLCAAGVAAPHRRQRLYWMAVADGRHASAEGLQRSREHGQQPQDCGTRRLANPECDGGRTDEPQRGPEERVTDGRTGRLADVQREGLEGLAWDGDNRDEPGRNGTDQARSVTASCGAGAERMGDTESRGCGERRDATLAGRGGHAERTGGPGLGGMADSQGDDRGSEQQPGESATDGRRGLTGSGEWSNFDIIPCRDGKARRIESGTFPLAHGIPGRVGLLRGYGNAIVPQVAAQFIQACEEAISLKP